MLTHLVAAHPDTTTATLTHLATTQGLSSATCLALLTHPRLPDHTDLTSIAPVTTRELHNALLDATPSRRTAILRHAHSAAPYAAIWQYIHRYPGLTTTEIRDAVTAHPEAVTTSAYALIANPTTPRNLAHTAIDHLSNRPGGTGTFRQQMTLIAGAERHHYDLEHLAQTLTARHPGDTRLTAHLDAYLTARRTHAVTYAQHLLATLPHDASTWGDAITATSDAHLAAAALTQPALHAAARIVVADPRLAHLHAQAGLARLTKPGGPAIRDAEHHLETDDPDTTHAAIAYVTAHHAADQTFPPEHARQLTDLLRQGARNPGARSDTLDLIAAHLHPDHTAHLDYALLAAHPNATGELRTSALERAGDSTHPSYAALITIAHHLAAGDTRPARDAPSAALTTGGFATAVLHPHVQTTAYTHPHWPRTHTGELALLALAPGFTGTLDQLLTAAHAVSR